MEQSLLISLHKCFAAWAVKSLPFFLCLCMLGCSHNEKVIVTGEVTIDGTPLEEGVITFRPTNGGPSYGGSVEKGRFVINENGGGILPVNYVVLVESWRLTGKSFKDVDGEGVIKERIQFILPKYNQKSELTASVKGGGTHFEFKLESKQ